MVNFAVFILIIVYPINKLFIFLGITKKKKKKKGKERKKKKDLALVRFYSVVCIKKNKRMYIKLIIKNILIQKKMLIFFIKEKLKSKKSFFLM